MIKVNYKSNNSTIAVVGANSGIGIALLKELLEIGSVMFFTSPFQDTKELK